MTNYEVGSTNGGRAEVKQFGLDAAETLQFSKDIGDVGATVVQTNIPTSTLNSIGDFTPVDTFDFVSGTVTIPKSQLPLFNSAIGPIIGLK